LHLQVAVLKTTFSIVVPGSRSAGLLFFQLKNILQWKFTELDWALALASAPALSVKM